MKKILFLVAGTIAGMGLRAAEPNPLEAQVAEAVKSPKVTLVHFWAPWCPNCKAELSNHGWSSFIAANPDVNFIFITTWQDTAGDGKAMLEKYGVGAQKNVTLLVDPNPSKKRDEKTSQFLGLPLTWIPTTWIFREGKLRYAFNYGELRFPIVGQLIHDSSDKWQH